MKKLVYAFLILTQIAVAQTVTKTTETALEASSFIGYDAYKNIYYTKEMGLHKKGKDGNFVFNDFQLGEITSVDIINPLNVVIFYQDTNTVVLLDNKLAEIQRFNFNFLEEFINVGAARNAGNNRLWLFNIDTQQIELYDYLNKIKTVISQPQEDVLTSTASDFNYFYALFPSAIKKYNPFGGLLFEITHEDFTEISQHDENLAAVSRKGLFFLKKNTKTFEKIVIPEITVKDLQLTQDFMYIYDGKTIHTFTINQPKK